MGLWMFMVEYNYGIHGVYNMRYYYSTFLDSICNSTMTIKPQ